MFQHLSTDVPAARPTRLVARAAALAAVLVCALALSACGSGSPEASGSASGAAASGAASAAGEVSFTDDLGNEVVVHDPKRVVVGMGSLADIWRDAGGSFAGVSDDAYDSFGFDRSQVPGIGRHTNPSLEKIMALKPDFVIMSGLSDGDGSYAGPSQTDLKKALDRSGVPVAFFSIRTFDDYLRVLKTCTRITGRADLYQKNGADVQQRAQAVLKKYDVSAKAPSVLVLNASSKGVSAQDPSHMASAMVKQLGAKLVTEEHPSLLKEFSLEAVAQLDPDYVFVVPAARDDATARRNYENSVANNPAWQGIGAVKSGHAKLLDLKHFFRKPNAEWDQAYETLGRALAELG